MWSDLAADAWRQGREAADPAVARRWLERARRIARDDDTIGLSLALACLSSGETARAQALFAPIARRRDLLEAWIGLAAAALREGDLGEAVRAMQAALSRHVASPEVFTLAASVVAAAGLAGWCGADQHGLLHADAAAEVSRDGRRLAVRWRADGTCRLPPGQGVSVERNGVALLGSPVDLAAMAAVEGFVEAAADGGLAGWAWHPRNPGRDPALTVHFADGTIKRLVAREAFETTDSSQPLARPRRFRIAGSAIPPGLTAVRGDRMLWGSPIDPGLERRSAAGSECHFMPVWADVMGTGRTIMPARQAVDVVVPVYRGVRLTLACLHSVLPTLPDDSRLHVVDDGAVDAELGAALDGLAAQGAIVLHRLVENRGFPGAANTGLRAAAGRDVVLLNSDTVVPTGWLRHLAEAAYGAPDIGSVCPLSNDATILSYPKRGGGNPMTDPAVTASIAQRANGAAVVDIPVSVGFCMYMRHDCLGDVGLLREDLWGQGYGEENDWCLRARHRGWRHVAATGCFVAHEGGASFGAARGHLLARNGALLERLHPGYGALVAAWIGRDPLGPARRRMDLLRWHEGRRPSAVALVTHSGGGGVDRVVAERCRAWRADGVRPVVIRPGGSADGGAAVLGDGDTPNLRYRLPEEWGGLLRVLRADRVGCVELHHTLGHAPEILELAARLGVPHEVFVHDYASFCARIALVPEHGYCGEPPVSGCEACVADYGSNLEEDIRPTALVARSAALLAAASRVIAPAADVAARMRRHFPLSRLEVMPWEDDGAIAPPPPTRRPIRHVCVVGGIGVEKGFEVLLACVRDAAARALPLRFTVVGYTADDERLLAAGPVFITGQYEEAEAVALIRAQAADIALLPSIWPETWCFTLGQAWRAGLRTAVFDLGTPAERVRRTSFGDVLPLGLPASSLNNWLLREQAAGHRGDGHGRPAHQSPSPSPRNPAI